MSSPDALNGRPVAAAADGLQQRGSFVIYGRGMGPSPLTDPAFAHHANSELVDLSREYEYPYQYQHLKALGLISAVGFGCCYFVLDKDMLQQPEFVLVAVLGFLATCFGGFFFLCVNCAHFLCAPVSPPQLLSRTELRHLLGTTACTFWTILLLLAGALKHFISGGSQRWLEVELFLIESFGAIVVMVPAWYIVNRFSTEPVKAGLIMSMFWSGAIFSAECAGIFNTILLLIWTSADPNCNASLPVGVICADTEKGTRCEYSRTGKLVNCVCEGEVNETTRKCESNETASGTEVFNNVPHIVADWEDVTLEIVDAKNISKRPSFKEQGWYTGTVPKVVDGIHRALGEQEKILLCPPNVDEAYVCGPKMVNWWPGPWTSWLLGIGIIVLFSVLACCVLPFVEKDFHARRRAAAAEAANRSGQLVQMA